MEVVLSGIKNCNDLIKKEIEFLRKNKKIKTNNSLKELSPSLMSLKIKNLEEAISLTYQLKTVGRVGLLLGKFEFKSFDELKSLLIKNFPEIINFLNDFKEIPKKTFAFRLTNKSGLNLNRMKIQEEIGGLIEKEVSKEERIKVDLDNPNLFFRLIISENRKAFFILDLVGEKDLSKRNYKIYNHPSSLNSVLAQNLIYFSDVKKESSFLDPMAGIGTICIEFVWKELFIPAGYLREDLQIFKINGSKEIVSEINNNIEWEKELKVYCTDKLLKNVEYAKKNARIARVEDKINFSRVSVDWLDWKFDEGEIDYIITQPPNNIKLLKELFYQAEFMGNNVVLATSLNKEEIRKIAKEHRYFLKNEKLLERKDNINFYHYFFK